MLKQANKFISVEDSSDGRRVKTTKKIIEFSGFALYF
jgi:hypothetical protein